MGQPSLSTIKRLFAVSHNQCAFPGCLLPLVDSSNERVIGKVCHIKANNPRGPRYDPLQSEEERQSFTNLMILCSNHHDVIDSDIEAYTVERLNAMKEKHESSYQVQEELNDEIAKQLIASIEIASLNNGSSIISINQHGGQVAHQITNVGFQPKQIPPEAIPEFIDWMKKVKPIEVKITANLLDPQTHFLANQLVDLLPKAGWKAYKDSLSVWYEMPKGIIFIVPELLRESVALDILSKLLKGLGFTNYRILTNKSSTPIIVINGV